MEEKNKFFIKWLTKKWFITPFIHLYNDFIEMFRKQQNSRINIEGRLESFKRFIKKPLFYENIGWTLFIIILIAVAYTKKIEVLWFTIPCFIIIIIMKIWWYWHFNTHWRGEYRKYKIKKELGKSKGVYGQNH